MNLLRTAMTYERGVWVSLFRWILRRPDPAGPGARFGYSATTTPVLLAFIGVSIVEIPILHFLLPWRTVQIVAFVISAWGLLWMVGLLGALRVHPHLVQAEGIRVRSGFTVDAFVPWSAVAEIRTRNRPLEKSKGLQYEETAGGLIGKVVVLGQTNVELVLTAPTEVGLPRGPISELHFWADDPRDLVAAARGRLVSVG
ncbi:PH domain-containing protein [Asanoa sp. WMMD1127]|uniref:PH domain-containing protein n=1 Tax=Asanoa sp. WMMD1127 TaxID=3016107 RepID=UPI002416A72D|nr:PH domain-containing protein [Asanoa sp. WMMD1127]MDG4822869.1 PH domain-containing protein [Asanoa sp. WMMD1127]